MKTFKYILILLASLGLLSCKGDEDVTKAIDIAGEWELVDYQTKSITIGDQIIEVYFTFNQDNTFNLRQRLGAGRYREYSGTWKLEGNLLTGNYSDGKAWGAFYQISLENDMLQMTPELDGAETYSYGVETYIYRKIK